MPVPDYESLMRPTLAVLADGQPRLGLSSVMRWHLLPVSMVTISW